MKPLQWFRMYAEAVDDEKLRLLSFEDRWHFVALLCCKASGILDDKSPLMIRKVAIKLGLDPKTLEEVAQRLSEVELIDRQTLQPLAWGSRQFESDYSKERVRAYRERKKHERNKDVTLQKRDRDVTVTAQETETEAETETETESEAELKDDDNSAPTSTRAGEACVVVKKLGVSDVNQQHPKLLALLERGATVQDFADSVPIALEAGKGFAYLLGVVGGRMDDVIARQSRQKIRSKTRDSPESFRERDDRLAKERWEQMTGRKHPDLHPRQSAPVIDITPSAATVSTHHVERISQ